MDAQFMNEVLELVNEERSNASLNPLESDTQLETVAENHSESMAVNDFFGHQDPTDGSTAGDRIDEVGYDWSSFGENVASGYATPEEVMDGWMNSPGHRANILNPDFTEIGIGYEFLENDTGSVNYNHYWTQVFGTPIDASPEQPVDEVDQEQPVDEVDQEQPVDEVDQEQPVDEVDQEQPIDEVDQEQPVDEVDQEQPVDEVDQEQPVDEVDQEQPVDEVDQEQPIDEVDQEQPVDEVDQEQPVDEVDQEQPVDEVDQEQPVDEVDQEQPINEVDQEQPVDEVDQEQPVDEIDQEQLNDIDQEQPVDAIDQEQLVDDLPSVYETTSEDDSSNNLDLAGNLTESINEERANAGLDSLQVNEQLSDVAQNYSLEMASDDFVSHQGLDGSTPEERIAESGYEASIWGENIVVNSNDVDTIMDYFMMGSNGNRENILDPDFQDIGIGYEYLENDTGSVNPGHYVTVNFGASEF